MENGDGGNVGPVFLFLSLNARLVPTSRFLQKPVSAKTCQEDAAFFSVRPYREGPRLVKRALRADSQKAGKSKNAFIIRLVGAAVALNPSTIQECRATVEMQLW
jgi:hypothetical protein